MVVGDAVPQSREDASPKTSLASSAWEPSEETDNDTFGSFNSFMKAFLSLYGSQVR
jgi:hypothetical protein